MTRKTATVKPHPAPFSMEVIDAFRPLLHWGDRVHDPFAGGGERLGALCDELGLVFTGTDIEPEFASDPRIVQGNACDPFSYPLPGFTVVTSPAYPNGIADHFEAKDSSRRRTYRQTLAKILGQDRPLHEDNQGRYGYRGTPLSSTSRAMYWNIASRAIDAWTEAGAMRALVNLSDFKWGNGSVIEPVVDGWAQRLMAGGWRITKAHKVNTPRDGYGANQDEKVDFEVILVAVPAPLLNRRS